MKKNSKDKLKKKIKYNLVQSKNLVKLGAKPNPKESDKIKEYNKKLSAVEVHTMDIKVYFTSIEKLKETEIDQLPFIKLKASTNPKTHYLDRKLELNPSKFKSFLKKLKKITEKYRIIEKILFLKKFLKRYELNIDTTNYFIGIILKMSIEKIYDLEKSNITHLLKVLKLIEGIPAIDTVDTIARIDFAFNYNKKYSHLLNLNKLVMMCIDPEDIDELLITMALLEANPEPERSILKKGSTLEVAIYNKANQLNKPNGILQTRLEFRFKRIKTETLSIKEIIEKKLNRTQKILSSLEGNIEDVEKVINKAIINKYDAFKRNRDDTFKSFLNENRADMITGNIMKELYKHSELEGSSDGYLKYYRKKFKVENPLPFVSNNKIKNYTKLLCNELKKYKNN